MSCTLVGVDPLVKRVKTESSGLLMAVLIEQVGGHPPSQFIRPQHASSGNVRNRTIIR